jgi:hypothetical protein
MYTIQPNAAISTLNSIHANFYFLVVSLGGLISPRRSFSEMEFEGLSFRSMRMVRLPLM